MKNITKIICVTFGCIISVQITGCISSEAFYQDVRLSRKSAYKRWKAQKEKNERSRTYISGKVGMKDCLKLTLANNKSLKSILQEKDYARGERIKSYSAILPAVGLTGQYLRKDEVASLGPITFGTLNNYSADLQVTQPIFAGGSIPSRINSAKLFSLLADEQLREAVQNVIFQAAQAYYDVLLNQHLYNISDDAVRMSKANLKNVKQKRQAGVASDFDVLRAQVELSNYKADLIQNKNAINIAKANLVKVMGVSQDSSFKLSDELIYNHIEITKEQAVKSAYQNRPDLISSELNIKSQIEQLRIAESKYWPQLNGFFNQTWSKPDPHNTTNIEWGDAWNAGVTANFPIFDGLVREGEIIQQKARLKQAQIDLIDAEENALLELSKALSDIESAVEFVESQRLNLERAKEGLRLAKAGYREGTKTQVETLDAQTASTTALANYYQAIYSHLKAKLSLYKAMGVLTTYKPIICEEKITGAEAQEKQNKNKNSENYSDRSS